MKLRELEQALLHPHQDEAFENLVIDRADEWDFIASSDSLSRAVVIDLLSSIERKSWNCEIVHRCRTQLIPFFKRILAKDEFETLILSGSDEVRYALAAFLTALITTNDELGSDVTDLLSDVQSLQFKLIWCRRALRFLSKRQSEICENCRGKSHSIKADYASLRDQLFHSWTICLQGILYQSPFDDPNDVVDLLATTCEIITNDSTKQHASHLIIDSWSSSYGKPLLKLLTTPDRLIIRHTLELLYNLFGNVLHDLYSPGHRFTSIENVVGDFLTNFSSEETVSAVSEATSKGSWFGGEEENGVDFCLIRLIVLVPSMASAIMAMNGSYAASTGKCFPIRGVDLTDIGRVVCILIEQDDHVCNFFLSCVIMKKVNVEWSYDPHDVWLHFLSHIGWSEELVIDWLASSETTFLLAFLQYLKLLVQDPTSLNEKAYQFSSSTSSSHCPNTSAVSTLPQFTVIEIIGDMEKMRTINLKRLRPRRRGEDPDNEECSTKNVWDKVQGFHSQLQRKLERHHQKNLLGFNVQPLLKLLCCVNSI